MASKISITDREGIPMRRGCWFLEQGPGTPFRGKISVPVTGTEYAMSFGERVEQTLDQLLLRGLGPAVETFLSEEIPYEAPLAEFEATPRTYTSPPTATIRIRPPVGKYLREISAHLEGPGTFHLIEERLRGFAEREYGFLAGPGHSLSVSPGKDGGLAEIVAEAAGDSPLRWAVYNTLMQVGEALREGVPSELLENYARNRATKSPEA